MKKTLACLLLLTACGGRQVESPEVDRDWQTLLDRGRFHRFFPKQSTEGYALYQKPEEIHAVQQLADSPYAAWLRFDTRLMPDIANPAIQDQLDAIASNYGALLGGLNPSEWQPSERFLRHDEDRLFMNYLRRVQGLSVRDNILQLVLVETEPGIYRLSEIQSNITGPAPTEFEPTPQIDDVEWLEDLTGRSNLSLQNSSAEWIPFLEDGTFRWQKATIFNWQMDGQDFQATLLPETEQWLDAWSLQVHAKPMVTRALKRSYAEQGPREYPLSFSAANGSSGNFILGAEALMPVGFIPASVGLSGPRATVYDNQAVDAMSFAGILEQDQGFILPADPSRLAAVNAFVSVQRINRFVRQFLSSEDAPFLGQALVVHVNLAEQTCNAFYSPKQQRLLLYKEGKGCANMALLNDVIYHEWGHALDDHVGRSPGIRDPAFSEGLADITAAYYNDDPAIAPYFLFDDPSPIRSLTEARAYPDDLGPMHYEGGIISSTFWELRELLIDRYGSSRGAHLAGKLFFRHLLAVDTYLESYAAVLRIDDDDRNPATPGPNHCLINGVFARHGLAENESCHDLPPPFKKAPQDLNLALLDAGPEENAVHVLASAHEADRLLLCMGAEALCASTESLWIPLQLVDRHPERSFFMSSAPILLDQLSLVTLIRLDAEGKVQDSRVLKIFAK